MNHPKSSSKHQGSNSQPPSYTTQPLWDLLMWTLFLGSLFNYPERCTHGMRAVRILPQCLIQLWFEGERVGSRRIMPP